MEKTKNYRDLLFILTVLSYSLVARLLGEIFYFLPDSWFNLLPLFLRLAYIALSVWLLRKYGKSLIAEKKFKGSYVGLSILAFFMVFAWSVLTSQIFPATRNGQAVEEVFAQTRDSLFYLRIFLGTCLLAPICEELLFRGLLMNALYRFKSYYLDLLTSATAFSLIHVIQHGWVLTDFVTYFGMGFIFALVYRKTKSLFYPIAVHMAWNSFLVVLRFMLGF